MVVIYAEKSSLAKEIAKALGAGQRHSLKDEPTVGYYEFEWNGENAVICHGVGHLAQLLPAKAYDEKYAKWDLSVFPCIPDTYKIAAKAQTKACMSLVKSFFDKADWLVNATDPDREGELIFSYVKEVCKCSAPVKRVWIEDLTAQKIQYAFDHLKAPDEPLSPTEKATAQNLELAARARGIADWVIGSNLTVATTVKYSSDGVLSVGRVQTPTLALIVNREKAILSHKKTPFWKLTGTFDAPDGKFEAEYEKGNFTNEKEAADVLNECKGKNGIVTSLETKHRKESAPLLYNATQLQIAANKKLGWDSDKTASVMQRLYEAKLMSYPRTTSEHLTDAMQPEVKLTIQKILKLPEYEAFAPAEWEKFTKRHFDDSKVGSHPAVIPTVNVPDSLKDLNEDEKALYDLLCKSLLRIIHPKAEIDDTTAIINVDGKHDFKATGSVIVKDGWYAVDARPEKKNVLPKLEKDMQLAGEYAVTKGETQPPKRYTEAELLAAMETAGQKIEDEEARTLMKMQKKGLGTDATRVPTIKGLFAKNYIARKGKTIYPTELGMFLIDKLPVEDLKSAEMTGEMEKRLNDIALGTADYDAFIQHIHEQTRAWFNEVAQAQGSKFVSEADKKMLCPCCGEKLRKFDWGYGCAGYKEKGCKFHINATICGKKITENHVILLCQNGRTGIIKGFKAKSGNTFDAYLVVDQEKQDVVFKFPDKKDTEKKSKK